MKKNIFYAAALFAGWTGPSAGAAPDAYRVYFGTMAKQAESGIYMALLDRQTGQLGNPVHVSRAPGAGFLAIHPDGQHLYSTGANREFDGIPTGVVNSFRITEPEGTLTDINSQPSGGPGACHLSIDPSGKNLLAANYAGGSCAVLPIRGDGALAPASSVRQHSGSSIHPKRQNKAFAHSVNCDPAGQFAIVADLGMDQLMIYRFDAASGTLTPNDPPFTATEPGGGPRHFTFHPSGKFAYANLELGSKVTAFRYDAVRGVLTAIQTLSTLPDTFDGLNSTSEILTSPDGRFLYVANRGHNSLALFSADPDDGRLTLLGHEPTRGETPRNFGIDPSGTWLIAANQKTGNAVVFRINRETGRLEFTGSEISIPSPSCVRFLAAPKGPEN